MRSYFVLNGIMHMKIDGEIVDMPDPIPPEVQVEIDKVWAEYDQRGRPFMSYHSVGDANG